MAETPAAPYKTPPTPQAAAVLAEMEAKARATKKPRRAAAKRPRLPRLFPRQPMFDAHVTSARPFLILRAASIGLGHDPLPLSYFASAAHNLIAEVCRCERCHPTAPPTLPSGSAHWGIAAPAAAAPGMGPGAQAPGVRIA